MPCRIAVVTASKGTMLGHALSHPNVRSNVVALLSDRECGALDVGRVHGLDVRVFPEPDNESLSDRICDFAESAGIDAFVVVFSRLLRGRLIAKYRNRIFNVHPSLLPAFPGMGSFQKAIDAGVRFIGTTIHAVDEGMDSGLIVLQCAVPNVAGDPAETRHRLFVCECKMLIQLIAWLAQDRIVGGADGIEVKAATYDNPTFSPALDDPDALSFAVRRP